MSKLPKIPRHDKPFSEDAINLLLGSEVQWFDRGSVLFHRARAAMNDLGNVVKYDTMVVGLPRASLVSPVKMTLGTHQIVTEMLYGMAVECWLKGFIVMAQPRPSEKVRRAVSKMLNDICSSDQPDDAYLGSLLQAMRTPEVKRLMAEQDLTKAQENKLRVELIKKHKQHDLLRLASDAGVKPYLKPHDVDYLVFLSKAIMLGRYPVTFKPEDVIPWVGVACDPKRWDSLNEAIATRYDQLRIGHTDMEEGT